MDKGQPAFSVRRRGEAIHRFKNADKVALVCKAAGIGNGREGGLRTTQQRNCPLYFQPPEIVSEGELEMFGKLSR